MLFCLSFVGCASAVQAKEWRGIIPARSTRADVIRLFGTCSDARAGCTFQVQNEEVFIVFSELRSQYHPCEQKLPPDTVLLVQVKLITPVKLEQLPMNTKSFRTFDPSYPRNIGYKGYINESEGVVIQTYKGEVLQLDYIAARKDVRLCPSYYDRPKSFIQVFIEMCCPRLDIDCPSNPVIDGERIIFSAYTDELESVTLKWEVTAGRIVGGQNTPRITVDTTGVGGRVITATVERNDGNLHTQTTSCTTRVLARPD